MVSSSPEDDELVSSSPVVPPQAASTRADTARPATSPGRAWRPRRRRPVVCSVLDIETVLDLEDMGPSLTVATRAVGWRGR
ncbi:exported protein of unknown function [Modestobacter italicus]|uniref:Uncharacterized protein n=1 Tax=Modestobacter italicus (strain DSM 44449 / CECT 9708 / BC 501) TaxID=2732864 RepID=I4F1N9_MODI5|nr:exported protein of unknown function [Modestobacter marinus]